MAEQTAAKAPAHLKALLGQKLRMTQIFDEREEVVPVTILKVGPCFVVGVRTQEKDGYRAVQVGFGSVAEKSLSKSVLGWFKKRGIVPSKFVREFRVKEVAGFELGQVLNLEDRFKPGDYVDVAGISVGKGFAGGMKRHGFHGGPASHGQSDRDRAPGSLAARRSLGRVLPGQRMAGHLGCERTTIQKLEVIQVHPEENLLYLKGAVPGPEQALLFITETSRPQKHRAIPIAKISEKKAKKGGKPPSKKATTESKG